MSNWAYCQTCQAGLNRPTIRECIAESQQCRNLHANPVYHAQEELADRLQDMWDRVAELSDAAGLCPLDWPSNY